MVTHTTAFGGVVTLPDPAPRPRLRALSGLLQHGAEAHRRARALLRADLTGWSAAAVVMTVLGTLQGVQILREPSAAAVADTAAHADVMNSLTALACAALVYLQWRITANEAMAWLAPGLLIVGLSGSAVAVLSDTTPEGRSSAPAGWDLALELALLTALLTCVAFARRFRGVPHPLALGLGVAMVLATAPLVAADSGVLPTMAPGARTALGLLVASAYAAIAVLLLRLDSVPRWFRRQASAAVVLLGCSQVLAHSVAAGAVTSSVVVACGVAGTAGLWGAAYVIVQQAFRESLRSLAAARAEVRELELGSRADRARLHEIEATLAGIATADRLLRDDGALTRHQRVVVEEMVRSESARLRRLMSDQQGEPSRAIVVDHVVRPLVERQRASGARVSWRPSGLVALGNADHVATAVSTLLENAARHAPGAPVRVEVRQTGECLEIVVSDSGPGVAPELRERLFQWGGRRADSPGQGIGLHSARQLLRHAGGNVLLRDALGSGATFVITLRTPQRGSDHTHVARTIAPSGSE